MKTSTGKTGPLNLFFKLPICIDGSYPATLKMADDERKNKEMKACKQSVLKGSVKDGFETGSINFNGCPKNGEIGIFYDGACKELNPGSNSAVKEFKLDTQGALSIQMLIPQQCLKSGVSNKWRLYFFERRGATYPKEVIGNRSIAW